MASFPRLSNQQLVIERQWYSIRDMLLGQNSVSFDFEQALKLAASFEHPSCQWLAKLFAGKVLCDGKDVQDVFLGEENDARALGFAAVIEGAWARNESWTPDEGLLWKSADLGFAFSQAQMVPILDYEQKSFDFAYKAALQGERDGFFELGFCFRYACGVGENYFESNQNYLRAAELGHITAAIELGKYLDKNDPQKWIWWGRAARAGGRNTSYFLYGFPKVVEAFKSGSACPSALFAIGQALHGNVNAEQKKIFSAHRNFDLRIGPAIFAIDFYKAQLRLARSAVDMWTRVGIRHKVVKDIRIVISKLIWEARNEAQY